MSLFTFGTFRDPHTPPVYWDISQILGRSRFFGPGMDFRFSLASKYTINIEPDFHIWNQSANWMTLRTSPLLRASLFVTFGIHWPFVPFGGFHIWDRSREQFHIWDLLGPPHPPLHTGILGNLPGSWYIASPSPMFYRVPEDRKRNRWDPAAQGAAAAAIQHSVDDFADAPPDDINVAFGRNFHELLDIYFISNNFI